VVLALLFLLAVPQTFDESYRSGLLALQRNDLPAARAGLQAAERLAPTNARVKIALAQVFAKSGEAATAQADAVKALLLAPADPAVRQALAAFYSLTKPTEPELYFAATQPSLQAQNFGEAATVLEAGRKRIGRNAQIELALGVAYYGLRRFEESADAFLHSIEEDPSPDQPYLFLGRMLDQIPTRLKEATERFSQFEANRPENPAGYLLHAQGLNAQGIERDKAQALLEKSIALDNSNPIAHFELANLLDRKQNFEAAAGEFERAAALKPDDAATHYRLSRDYDRLGRREAAEKERQIHAALIKVQEPIR
jgi:tetratricopeptide (TPR) repeat protein